MDAFSICLSTVCGVALAVLALDLSGELLDAAPLLVESHSQTLCERHGSRWQCVDLGPSLSWRG